MYNGLKILCFFAFTLFTITGCNNDLNLTEEGIPVPVTYALINSADTAHYVRLEKSFIHPIIPPSQLALDVNNLYYTNAIIELINTRTNQKFRFNEVDGEKEGYPRKDGAFAKVPNKLYKLKNQNINWNNDDNYKLSVTTAENNSFEAVTKIVGQSFLIRPNAGGNLDFDDTQIIRYSWNPGKNAVLYSMKLRINIRESTNNGPFIAKYIDWQLFSNITPARFEFSGKDFYTFLGNNLQKSANIKRFVDGIDVTLTSGGNSIQEFTKVSTANLEITSSGEVPVFTNFSQGRGLFGSIFTSELKNIPLSRASVDRLKTNNLTKDLNFQ
jgi:hypothetical protein